jgi:hypothetical protein
MRFEVLRVVLSGSTLVASAQFPTFPSKRHTRTGRAGLSILLRGICPAETVGRCYQPNERRENS